VLSQAEDLMLYEYDGSVELGSPECVVFPSSTREVAENRAARNRYELRSLVAARARDFPEARSPETAA